MFEIGFIRGFVKNFLGHIHPRPKTPQTQSMEVPQTISGQISSGSGQPIINALKPSVHTIFTKKVNLGEFTALLADNTRMTRKRWLASQMVDHSAPF